MINKINKIKNFGVFKDFNGSTLPEFKTFNLIYGWNYSGKTTLSRVFRCLEKAELHNDYSSATFELENSSGKYDQNFSHTLNIRVFNSDFIKENLKWDSENIEPIFLLGEENIELQKELKEKETVLETSLKKLEEYKRLRQEKLSRINRLVTSKARDIGTLLSIRPFDSRHFLPIIKKIKADSTIFILDQEDFDKYKAQAISNEQKPLIGEAIITIADISKLKNEVEQILHRQAASSKKIQKLLDDKIVSDWVEEGKDLHQEKDECEFCGNTLPVSLLVNLNEHFSKDYDQLKSDIETELELLRTSKINFTTLLPAETAFYTDLQPSFKTNKTLLENEIIRFNSVIDSLVKDIEAKRENPFDKLKLSELVDNTAELKTALSEFNKMISFNDKRTADFTSEKNAAIEKIKEHYVARFETTETYSVIQTQLVNEQTAITINKEGIETQKQAIITIKAQLDETIKGAGKVNDYLKVFFGKDDIQIAPTTDKKFQLMRDSEVAKNLSEGEKTAISFAYFTAKLEEQNNKISEAIVYIDDPISSLDSNHLFNIYSFIRNTFYENTKDQNGGNVHVCKCKQLYISTHNFEFYNLVYDWFSKTKNSQTPQSYYIIERTKNAQKDESNLIESNSLIQKYKSEYVYLFSLINKFHQAPADNFENLYHLPNILRKFVETFLNFKFLSSMNVEESIDLLITNPIECERARKFMHYYSHSLTTDKFMKFADLTECKDVVCIVMDSVKSNDLVHFNSLLESVK